MARSKEIILFFVVAVLLVSCSSRRSFGTSYLAGNSNLGDSLSIHEELEEYLSYADDYKRDFILQQKQKRKSDSLISVDSTKTNPKLIETLDTTVVNDTMITKVEVSDAVESNNDSLKNQRSIYIDTVAMINQESDSSIIISSEIADSLDASKAILKDTVTTKRAYSDSLEKENAIVPEEKAVEQKLMDSSAMNSIKEAEEHQDEGQKQVRQKGSQQNQQESGEKQFRNKRNKGRNDNSGSNKIRPIIIINNKKDKSKSVQDTTISQGKQQIDTIFKVENRQIQDNTKGQLEKKSDESNSATIIPAGRNADSLENLLNDKEQKIESYNREKAALIESNVKLRKQTKLTNEKWDTLRYSIFFDSGVDQLTKENKAVLDQLKNDIDHDNYQIKLSGHTDKSGSAKYNKILSENRVKSVSNYLIKNGLNDRKIYFQSFGEKYATEITDLNRRIVTCLLILDQSKD